MIAGRDSKGRFTKSNVPWSKRVDGHQREVTTFVSRKLIGGEVVKLERVQVICPACGEQVEAVARDGQVKGYCAVAKQFVDFPIENRRLAEHLTTIEHRAKISAAHASKRLSAEARAKTSAAAKKRWQNPEYRARHSATTKKLWEDPEYRARQNATMKKRWQNPEYRARQIAARTGKYLTPEHRAKISATLKRRHNKKGAE